MQDLRISLIQSDIEWHNPEANRLLLSDKINSLKGQTDLIVLPEMFPTGFTMETKTQFEAMNGPTVHWMRERAIALNAVLCGSLIIKDKGHYYNRVLFVHPGGQVDKYDKRHLFRMAEEDQHFTAGKDALVINLKGWKIKPLICYDLRFPIWARNKAEDGALAYDLLIYVANWPMARVNAWDILLQARAIENLCYCAGINRIGADGNGTAYNGHSACYDFKGNAMSPVLEDNTITTITLDKTALAGYRKAFPAYQDADAFTLD